MRKSQYPGLSVAEDVADVELERQFDQFINNTGALFFDTETTGLIPKGAKYESDYALFPHIVELAWFYNGKHYDYIIKPDGWVIPEHVSKIHDITTEMAHSFGVPIGNVLAEFLSHCSFATKIIGHNVHFDTSIVKANVRRVFDAEIVSFADTALDKTKRIDTMLGSMKFVGAKREGTNALKFPSLTELHVKLFGESFDAHNALSDVKATVRCYNELVSLGVL